MAVYEAVTTALATSNSGPSLNSNGVVEWGVKNIIPLVLLIIGIGIIASARTGRISDNANTLTNVVLGMGVIAGAAVLYGFAGQLTDLVFGSG
jgi:predicted MFS family arabinose efflux permease